MVTVASKSKSGTFALAESVGVKPAVGVNIKLASSVLMLVTVPVRVSEFADESHAVLLVLNVPPYTSETSNVTN